MPETSFSHSSGGQKSESRVTVGLSCFCRLWYSVLFTSVSWFLVAAGSPWRWAACTHIAPVSASVLRGMLLLHIFPPTFLRTLFRTYPNLKVLTFSMSTKILFLNKVNFWVDVHFGMQQSNPTMGILGTVKHIAKIGKSSSSWMYFGLDKDRVHCNKHFCQFCQLLFLLFVDTLLFS